MKKSMKKSSSSLRWLILFLNCVMMIGNYYCYDIPASLHTQLDDFMANTIYKNKYKYDYENKYENKNENNKGNEGENMYMKTDASHFDFTDQNDIKPKPVNFEILFSLLYTVYSVPNIILPFFGGYFVDRFGVRICLLWFVFLILLGQSFFTLGLCTKSWSVMFLGRILYGLGGESLGVANGALLSEWFRGKGDCNAARDR